MQTNVALHVKLEALLEATSQEHFTEAGGCVLPVATKRHSVPAEAMWKRLKPPLTIFFKKTQFSAGHS